MQYTIIDLIANKGVIQDLSELAWAEVSKVNPHFDLDLDWEQYKLLNDAGMVRSYLVQNDNNEPVGFASFLVSKCLHKRDFFIANSDCLYIKPEYRSCGKELLSLVLEDLKDQGVNWVSISLVAAFDTGALGEHLDSNKFEHVYQRRLK
jgi:GNAT superfamily N-acetyltransferase